MEVAQKRFVGVDGKVINHLLPDFLVTSLSGCGQMSMPYAYEIGGIASNVMGVDSKKLLFTSMACTVNYSQGNAGILHGVITSVEKSSNPGKANLRLIIEPRVSLLRNTKNCRIFQDKSIPEIATEVLLSHQIHDFDFSNLQSVYAPLPYVVQYNESDLDFIQRLLAQAGIYYYFVHSSNSHTLIAIDNIYETPLIANVTYDESMATSNPHIYAWDQHLGIAASQFSQADYNPNQATDILHASASNTVSLQPSIQNISNYQFAGGFNSIVEGENSTQRAADYAKQQANIIEAKSDCDFLQVGSRVKIEGEHAGSFLITKIAIDCYDFSDTTSKIIPNKKYENTLSLLDAASNFVPKPYSKPEITGVHTALVVGPKDQEIYMDASGRVKIQFHWDRFGANDQHSSCWIRPAEQQSGSNWGTFYAPRVGEEVLVAYINGDIDKPIILGSVYNSKNLPPFDLPKEAQISGSKMPGHELSFHDKDGHERVFFSANKDYQENIEQDSRRIVKGSSKVAIKEGDNHIDVATGSSIISAAKSVDYSSGKSSISISPSGIVIAAPRVDLNPNSSGQSAMVDNPAAATDSSYDSLGVLGLVGADAAAEEIPVFNENLVAPADVNQSNNKKEIVELLYDTGTKTFYGLTSSEAKEYLEEVKYMHTPIVQLYKANSLPDKTPEQLQKRHAEIDAAQ